MERRERSSRVENRSIAQELSASACFQIRFHPVTKAHLAPSADDQMMAFGPSSSLSSAKRADRASTRWSSLKRSILAPFLLVM